LKIMKARFLLVCAALLMVTATLAPLAAAQQPTPAVRATVKWAMEHEMVLPENGRMDMEMEIRVEGKDSVCAKAMKYSVQINVGNFPKWAGASIEPSIYGPFTFEAGAPGMNAGWIPAKAPGSEKAVPRLNIVWDTESAPKKGAVVEYTVSPKLIDDPTDAGPCVQNMAKVEGVKSSPMVVRMPDRVDDTNNTAKAGEDCSTNPFQAKCNTATPQAKNSPGPDFVIVLVGLVALVAVWRRK
jgi:hypothetical protein